MADGCHLETQKYKNDMASCKEHADTNLIKYHLFVSYFAVFSNESHLDWPFFI